MRVIVPREITGSKLISTSVAEDDYDAYSSATTYAIGDYVIVTATHKIYQSLKASNLNHYPPDNCDTTDPYWLDCGYTNRWRMFDSYVNTSTVGEEEEGINVLVSSSMCDTVVLVDCLCNEAFVAAKDASGVAYSSSYLYMTDKRTSTTWSDYFFDEFSYLTSAVFTIPKFYNSRANLVLRGYNASCGAAIIGKSKRIGAVRFGLEMGISDYSIKSTDDFGATYLKTGNYKKTRSLDLYIDNDDVDDAVAYLESIRATPSVFIVDNSDGEEVTYRSSIVYGFYKDFKVVVSGPTVSECSVEVEGLI